MPARCARLGLRADDRAGGVAPGLLPHALRREVGQAGRGDLRAAHGERGLGKGHAAVWLYGEALTIAFADEPLARDRVRSQPGKGRPRAVEEPPVYETPSRSPQRALWERDDTEWLRVIRRPDYAPRRPRRAAPTQAALFP